MRPDHGIRFHVRHVDETGSTNDDVLRLLDRTLDADRPAVDSNLDLLVLRTGQQTAGRGRLDRRWDAPPGANLLFSILFQHPPQRPHVVTQAVSLAAVRAVDRVAGWTIEASEASLKWPNDVLLGGAKLAGLLAQRHSSGAVIAGMGLNVGWAPDGAAKLHDIESGVASSIDPAGLLDVLLDELWQLSSEGRFDAGGVDAAVMSAARLRTSTIGADVRVELPGGRHVEGRAVAIDDDGRLVVDHPEERGVAPGDGTGSRRVSRFDVGDIVHLRRPR